MKKLLLGLIGMALAGSLAQAKLAVVATTADLAAIAEAVGGSAVEVISLARPAEDPHFVEAKPSLIVKLRKADVLIEGGAELEAGWLPSLVDRAGNRKISREGPGRIRANEGVAMLEIPSSLDRSAGDIHASGNPHFLADPANAVIVARHISTVFSKLDPQSAATYDAQLKRFTQTLESKLVEWQRAMEPFRGQTVVGYHNSWPYFAKRFGLKIDLFLEPKPGLPPTPAHLAEVMRQMKERKARVIMVDRYLDRRTAETVAGRTGATVVEVSQFPGGIKGTEAGYVALMDAVVESLRKALAR
ncbi:MAG TPA: metal ABC transporter substrate-binding protein [Clostridia bacterium]|nr:metal ABC transporter substrate-binding protein [Clostridia bacterium]